MSSKQFYQLQHHNGIAVRYPFVAGKDDYTKRLAFYVEHTMKSIPMDIDNLNNQMGFIRSDEAGKFMAFLVEQDIRGAINGSAEGTISVGEIIAIRRALPAVLLPRMKNLSYHTIPIP